MHCGTACTRRSSAALRVSCNTLGGEADGLTWSSSGGGVVRPLEVKEGVRRGGYNEGRIAEDGMR